MSLETIAASVGLSLEDIVDVTPQEFHTWSKIGCKSGVITHASIFREWRQLRGESSSDITNLQTLCEQAGSTLHEILTLSANDFRQLTKAMDVGITQHTLVFQERNQCLEAMRRNAPESPTSVATTSLSVDLHRPKRSYAGELLRNGEELATEKAMSILLLAAGDREAKRGRKNRSTFTEEEDKIIIREVTRSEERPFTRWAELTHKLPGHHKSKQIRDRWVNHLDPIIKHEPFTDEEDMQLYDAIKNFGTKWAEISVAVFNSTRPENQLKNRRHNAQFKKKIAEKFGPDALDDITSKGTK